MAIAIRADGLSKSYRLGQRQRYKALRDVLPGLISAPFRALRRSAGKSEASDLFWALKDVSFEIRAGDAVGIIGRNGAGKSTLLKILSRITEPTTGSAEVKGRLASLLEVGTGFHPELSGRENIFLNGAILGMKKQEIAAKFDAIVDFSEVEKFLDTPVKYYSSGMYVRLAFAVAAHLEPDILLVDEVLAVGDAAFQKKCLGRMGEVAREGRTVVFVSHSLGTVSGLTNHCLYLDGGRLVDYGESGKIVQRYLSDSAKRITSDGIEFYRRDRTRKSPVQVTGIGLKADRGSSSFVEFESDLTIAIQLHAERSITDAHVDIAFKDVRGQRAALLFSRDSGFTLSIPPGESTVYVDVKGLPLSPGQYFCDVGVNQSTMTVAYDVILDFPIFEVINDGRIVHWLDRNWGGVHWARVAWSVDSAG